MGHVRHVAPASAEQIAQLPQYVDGNVEPDEPEARNGIGADDEEEHQNLNPAPGKQRQERAGHAGNRAACADHRRFGDRHVRQRRHRTADQVEPEEPGPPEAVFHRRAKHP